MNTELQGSGDTADNMNAQALQASLRLFDDDELSASDDALLERVRERVTELLSRQPERLMSILYRIDVQEQQVQHVMKNSPVGAIATDIAQLIINRMREKILTRQQYQQESSKKS